MQAMIQPDIDIKDSFAIGPWPQMPVDTALRRAAYHRLLLLQGGSGGLQVDSHAFPIQGSEIFLIAKGQLFAWQAGSKPEGFELAFGDCFWEKAPASAANCKTVLFNDASAHQRLPLPVPDLASLSGLFTATYTEFIKPAYTNKADALAAYLKIIMIKTANVYAALREGAEDHDRALYGRFLQLVKHQYQEQHEVAAFARQLGITTRKLSDLCRQFSGQGAKEIISEQLITEAKRFLQFSSRPVKEIAFTLNFSTPDQFSHFFKKKTFLSPQQYRERFVNSSM